MENEIIHRWRCMNCGKIADSYICSYCGKESYIKTNEEDISIKKTQKLSKDTEHINSEPEDKFEKMNFVSETSVKKELNLSIEQINTHINDVGKTIKSILLIVIVLFIAQSILFAIKYGSIKKSILGLEQTNESLSALASSQGEKIDNLKKALDENADSQIKYIIHTVKQGETMIEICKEYNIDYTANKSIINELNGMENSDIIHVGQILILPDLK